MSHTGVRHRAGQRGAGLSRFDVPQAEGRARYQKAHDIITKAWAKEPFSHAGGFWRFEEITFYLRPVQQPLPLVWVAGTSPEELG